MELLNDLLCGEFSNILLRFVLSSSVIFLIIDRLYYPKSKRRDFYFTFMLISVAIFFLVYFMMGMDRGKATMGVGLGLFGIFSIMRYRTDTMPVREMTYLFIIVCLSVVHAMSDETGRSTNQVLCDMGKLVAIDAIVLLFTWVCEKRLKMLSTKLVQYDRIDLIKPEKREELKADLEERLGLEIIRIEVGGVDFLRDSAVLRVTYKGKGRNSIDNQYEIRKSQWKDTFLF